MDHLTAYATRFGHAHAIAITTSNEVRLMVEYIRKYPNDAAWAMEKILLACDALDNVHASADAAVARLAKARAAA